MKITIAQTAAGNDPEAHRHGCADVARGRKNGKYQGSYDIDATSRLAVAADFWDCIYQEHADSHDMTTDEALVLFRDSYTTFLPCCAGLPAEPPAVEPTPAERLDATIREIYAEYVEARAGDTRLEERVAEALDHRIEGMCMAREILSGREPAREPREVLKEVLA